MHPSEKMTRDEVRASAALASIFGLRMLGMFLILPVFAIYAKDIPGGDNHMLVGLALGAYGLTQAMLQIPFGMASDRWGRKPVIVFGLIVFALGSFIAAAADDIWWTIAGRVVQGAGAISAAVTALLADLTREEHRTKAMATVGSTIGLTFAASLVLGPAFYRSIGVPGIFAMTGVLALAAIWVVKFVVPDPGPVHFHSDAEASPARLRDVMRDRELLRLNFGILALHAAQMAMFVVVPLALNGAGGMTVDTHWKVYLPILLFSFLPMVPALIYAEKKGQMKPVFVGSVALMLAAQISLAFSLTSFWNMMLALTLYFVAFNILEATLPSLISKLAPAEAKGTAMGVYNTSQALGLFLGGLVGGWLYEHHGAGAVFTFCGILMAAWLVFAGSMRRPPAVKTKMFHLGSLDSTGAHRLTQQLLTLPGVREVTVLAEEGVAILKVNLHGWDEESAVKIIQGEA